MKKKFLNKVSEKLTLKVMCKYSKTMCHWKVTDEVLPIYYIVSLTLFLKPKSIIFSGVNVSVFSKQYDKFCKNNKISSEPVWRYGIKLNKLIDKDIIEIKSDYDEFELNEIVLALGIAISKTIKSNFNLEKCIELNSERSKFLGKKTKVYSDLIYLQESNIYW